MIRVLVFLLLCFPALAQTWSAPVPFDTGWFSPADANCMPLVNEPTQSSDALDVGHVPPGAFMVRTEIEAVSYRNTIVAHNHAEYLASYTIHPTYSFRVGHVAGIYDYAGHLYAAGQGYADASHLFVVGVSAGTGPAERFVGSGDTDVAEYQTTYGPGVAVELQPVTPEWRARRHRLFATVEGQYGWEWWPWNGGHSPISYQSFPQVRVTGNARFAY